MLNIHSRCASADVMQCHISAERPCGVISDVVDVVEEGSSDNVWIGLRSGACPSCPTGANESRAQGAGPSAIRRCA